MFDEDIIKELKDPIIDALIASGRVKNYVNAMMKIETSNYFFEYEEPMPSYLEEVMAEDHAFSFCFLMSEEERIEAEKELKIR